MPRGPVPEKFHHILESTTLGHLATIGEEGQPQVNPVWFLWDGEHVLLSVRPVTVKYRNLRNDPRVAMSFLDLENPMHYVEIRGEVVEWELYTTLDFVNLLALKYTDADYTRGHAGEERYKVTMTSIPGRDSSKAIQYLGRGRVKAEYQAWLASAGG